MTPSQWAVTTGGVLAIGLLNWWFFAVRRPAASAPSHGGIQRLTVVVNGGYEPGVIRVRAGLPVRLEFDRRDQGSCTEEVVLPDFGIRSYLPPGRITAVEFLPLRPGRHEFTCGMGMVRGRVEVIG